MTDALHSQQNQLVGLFTSEERLSKRPGINDRKSVNLNGGLCEHKF